MQKIWVFYISVLIVFMVMPLFGCSNQASVQEERESETAEEIAFADISEEKTAITVPPGKTDRLPGSLRWSSVELYARGIDFFNDQPEGLASGDINDTAREEVTAAEPSEPAQAADTASQTTDSGQTGAGETSAGQDSSLPQDGDVFITTVDDTSDWGSVLTLDDEEEDDGKKWYELD